MNSRRPSGIAAVVLILCFARSAGAWVTCQDGTMADYGACPGPQGQIGPRGLKGHDGPRGLRGQTGPRGLRGQTGPRGPQGRTGPQGPRGATGHVRHDWAAMALAAGSIPHSDSRASIGVGLGVVDGTDALAAGLSLRIAEKWRASVTVMRTNDETALGAGIGFDL